MRLWEQNDNDVTILFINFNRILLKVFYYKIVPMNLTCKTSVVDVEGKAQPKQAEYFRNKLSLKNGRNYTAVA